MVAKWSDKEQQLKAAVEHVTSAAPEFLRDIASGNPAAVADAKLILTESIDGFRPTQIAGLLKMMLDNCMENYEKQKD